MLGGHISIHLYNIPGKKSCVEHMLNICFSYVLEHKKHMLTHLNTSSTKHMFFCVPAHTQTHLDVSKNQTERFN